MELLISSKVSEVFKYLCNMISLKSLKIIFVIFQVGIGQEGNTNKCLLKINSNISANGSNSREYKMRPSSSGCSSNDSYGSGSGTFRLPSATKETLTRMLDAPVSLGNDWRMLAERLNVHRYIAFATRPSPTEAILNLWEARNRESTAVAGLVNTLRGMARHDAAQVLDMDTSWP